MHNQATFKLFKEKEMTKKHDYLYEESRRKEKKESANFRKNRQGRKTVFQEREE